MTGVFCALAILGVASLPVLAQERAERRHRRPADPAWVARFLASRSAVQ